MIKELQKHGNSHAIVIDKSLMSAMGINPKSRLQLHLSGNSLIISPENMGVSEETLSKELNHLRKNYGQMLKNLAE